MEEPGFAIERSFKRRSMEAQAATVNGGVGNEVGGEVRKVHIIYYLCRNGRVEHPHLIRIHHHSRNGVHLRDVKRWLVELRGKDMPESFAWSFKRRYKKRDVWQDILNDDLITPICDNEYVLKGSEIYSTTLNNGYPSGSATSIDTQSPQQLQALQVMKAQHGFQPMPDTTPRAFIGYHLPHDHSKNNDNHKRSHFSWASSYNTVYGSCKQCGIGHIPSDCPTRDPSTFHANPLANLAYTRYNLADNKSYGNEANSHVTQDLSPLDNFETYYDIDSYEGKEVFELKTSPPFEGNITGPKYPSMRKEYSLDFSTNTSTEIEESSFGSNATTEDTTKNQDEDKDKEVVQIQDDVNENNSFHETLLNDNMDDDENNSNKSKKRGDKSEISYLNTIQSPNYSYRKSGQKSGMFLNWITCGTSNTHEKAVVVINKRNCSVPSTVSSVSKKCGNENNMGQICKEQKLRGFEKRFDTNDRSKKSKKEDSNNLKTFGAAYKPVNGPNCSQCGRQFNPEKLHNHMKYCRGMKSKAKSTNSRLEPNTKRSHSPSSKSMDTFFLTNN